MAAEILTEDEQEVAKDLANRIGKMLSDANSRVMVSALALSLATADVIDFVGPEARDGLREIIQKLTRDAVDILGEREEISETIN